MLIEAVALKAAHTQRVRHQVAMSSRERLMAGYERKKRSFAAHAQRAGTQREAQRAASHITRQRHTRIKCEVQIRSWRNVPHLVSVPYTRARNWPSARQQVVTNQVLGELTKVLSARL